MFMTIFRSLSMRCLAIATVAISASAAEDAELQRRTDLPPLAYTNAPAKIPNYSAGQKPGAPAIFSTQMQVPLSPADSAQHVVTRPGFTRQLWAAEPDIFKPTCMAWDERGRLWIAESIDYPNDP